MLLLLPPSETKQDGGDASLSLDLTLLSYPSLTRARRRALAATRSLSRNRSAMATALGLGPTQLFEVDRNRTLFSSPIMPALERYTGVLFDALDARSLATRAREVAARSVAIHSALFGLIGADDPIPAYRLSHDSRLPDVRLAAHWREAVSAVISAKDGLVLDLRSEAYVNLGPMPPAPNRWFLRVMAEAPDGRKRALNHFNKKGKGEFVRAVLESGEEFAHTGALLAWAAHSDIRLSEGAQGELELTVDEVAAGSRPA